MRGIKVDGVKQFVSVSYEAVFEDFTVQMITNILKKTDTKVE